MPKLSDELIITLLILAAEIGLLMVCRIKLRRPVDPLRPRLIPYGGISLFLGLALLVTAAHVVSLVTGHQLLPKQKNPGGMSGPGTTY